MDGCNFDEDAEINAVLSRYTDRDDVIEGESPQNDGEAVAESLHSAPLGSGVRQSSSSAGSNLRASNMMQPADDQTSPMGANPRSFGQNSGDISQSASAARMQEHLRLLEDQLAAGRQAIALEQQWTQEIRAHHRAIARLEQSQLDLAEQYGDASLARRGQAASSSSASASSGLAVPSQRAGASPSEGRASMLKSASDASSLGDTGRAGKRRRVEPPRRGHSQAASHSTARPEQPKAGLRKSSVSSSASSSSRYSAPIQGTEDAATTRNQLSPRASDSPAVRGVYEIGVAGETGGSTTSTSARPTSTSGSSSSSDANDKSAPLHSRLHVSQSMLDGITAALDSMPRVVKQSDSRELLESMVSGICTYWRDPTAPDGQVAPVFRINVPRDNHRAIAGPSLDQKRILVSTPIKMLKLSLPTEDARATMRRFRQTCIHRPAAASGSHSVSQNRQKVGMSPYAGSDPSVDGGTRGSTRDSKASRGASKKLPCLSLLIEAPKVVASEVQKEFLALSVGGSPVYCLSKDKKSVAQLAPGSLRTVSSTRDVPLCCWSPSMKAWIVTTLSKVYSKFKRATASDEEREQLARLVQMYTARSRSRESVSGPKQPPSSRADSTKRRKGASASRTQLQPTRQSKRASSARVGSFEELDSDIEPVGGSGAEDDSEYIARSPALGTKRSRDSSIGSKPSAALKSSAPSPGETSSAQRESAALEAASSKQSRTSSEPPNPEREDMPPAGIIRSMPSSIPIDVTVQFAQQVAAGLPVYFYEDASDSVERLGPNGLVSRLRRKPMACRSAAGSAWLVSAFTRIPAALQAGKLAQKYFNAIYERYGPSRQANGGSGAAASAGGEQSNPDVPPASLLTASRVSESESDTDEVASQLATGGACFRSSRSGDSVSPVPREFVPDSMQGDPIACRSADGSNWVRTTFHKVFNRLASGKLPEHVVQTVRSTYMTRPSWKDSAAAGFSSGTASGGNSSEIEKGAMTKGDADAMSSHISVAAASSSATGSSKDSDAASQTVAAGSLAVSSVKVSGFAARDASASPAAPPGGEPNSLLKRSVSKSGSKGGARGGSPASSSLGQGATTGGGQQ